MTPCKSRSISRRSYVARRRSFLSRSGLMHKLMESIPPLTTSVASIGIVLFIGRELASFPTGFLFFLERPCCEGFIPRNPKSRSGSHNLMQNSRPSGMMRPIAHGRPNRDRITITSLSPGP